MVTLKVIITRLKLLIKSLLNVEILKIYNKIEGVISKPTPKPQN